MKRQTTIILFFAIFALGAFLRFYHLGARQLWLDEILQLQTFSQPTVKENLQGIDVEALSLRQSSGRVYLVESIYMTSEQRRKVDELLESTGAAERIEFRGFKLHVLIAN